MRGDVDFARGPLRSLLEQLQALTRSGRAIETHVDCRHRSTIDRTHYGRASASPRTYMHYYLLEM
eukprot:scaffold7027_cov106-Isochrysis_galbana.AAC.5